MNRTVRGRAGALLNLLGGKKSKVFEVADLKRSFSCRRMLAFCFGDEDGNALIEFTLVLPILMAVLTGIFQLGIAFNNQLELTQGVGAAAQYLQVERTQSVDPCSEALTTIVNSAPMLVKGNVALTLTINTSAAVTASSCTSSEAALQASSLKPVTVYATYPCSISIYGFNFDPNCKLTAQVTEYEY